MSTTPEPPEDPQPAVHLLRGDADGQLGVPAGEYLVHVWPDGHAELAWRDDARRTWSPPVRLVSAR